MSDDSYWQLFFFFFYGYGAHRDLHLLTHSFPTQRSSDLRQQVLERFLEEHAVVLLGHEAEVRRRQHVGKRAERVVERKRLDLEDVQAGAADAPVGKRVDQGRLLDELGAGRVRSEEHTSELQSLMRISYAVFCVKKT